MTVPRRLKIAILFISIFQRNYCPKENTNTRVVTPVQP